MKSFTDYINNSMIKFPDIFYFTHEYCQTKYKPQDTILGLCFLHVNCFWTKILKTTIYRLLVTKFPRNSGDIGKGRLLVADI